MKSIVFDVSSMPFMYKMFLKRKIIKPRGTYQYGIAYN